VFGPDGMIVGEVPAAELAERFGTPLLVFDRDEIVRRMRAVRSAFPRAAYAVKAFTSQAMIRLALEEGLDLLCATGGELEACLRAGAPGERLLFHGNAKTHDELFLAVGACVGLVIADGPGDLTRLDAMGRDAGRVQPVLLRVIPEVKVTTHEAIATGHASSKFGTPRPEALEAAALARSLPAVRLEGFHAHAGSQVLEVEPYVRVLDALIDLAMEAGVRPSVLDVGGGFGVTYRDEPALDVGGVAAALVGRLRERRMAATDLLVEPGRFLVANAGVTLYRVVDTKHRGGRRLVAVDGGMADNMRPMLYDAVHEVRVAAAKGSISREGATSLATVVGRHCESGDTLAEHVVLPPVEAGDLLAMAATGAYAYPLASNYNRAPRPPVVVVGDGRTVEWLRREDAADLERLETGAGLADAAVGRSRTSPDGVEVRPARAGDARGYLELWRAVVAEGRWVRSEEATQPLRVYRRRFRTSWSSEGADLVAARGGRLVGHLAIQRERHPVTRHVATLGLAVAADERGLGIGAGLLAGALDWARSVGVEKVVLSVYPHNAAAIGLYRRFGFVEEGRLSRQSRKSYGYEDEILMACWIGEEPS